MKYINSNKSRMLQNIICHLISFINNACLNFASFVPEDNVTSALFTYIYLYVLLHYKFSFL